MKKLILLILTFSFSMNLLGATDLNGTWSGTRFQFDETKSRYMAEFDYKYVLEQTGNQVEGKAYINKKEDKSNFAVLLVRGFIEDNKFYFEEYQIIDQYIRPGYVWCLKKGVLELGEKEGMTTLSGKTKSFMDIYGYECTGGYTFLSLEEVSISDEEVTENTDETIDEKSLNYTIYPNPFAETTNLTFTLNEESEVSIDVVDINGSVIKELKTDEIIPAGDYTISYTPESNVTASYFYIRLFVNGRMYTKAVQKYEGNNATYK